MRIKDIAEALGAPFAGEGELDMERLVHPQRAERGSDLALAMSGEAAAALSGSKALAAVVSVKNAGKNTTKNPPAGALKALITVAEPRLALARLTALFDPGQVHAAGVHPTAIVAPDAMLGEDVSIGPYAVIGPRSRIGAQTVILPHVTIGADVSIGSQGLLHAGVRIGDHVAIGDRVIIHANAVIGADGFSFSPDLTSPTAFVSDVVVTRVHSLGTVTIEDDVEIGAATTIDRSTIETTQVGRGTKIDNHVHIGHNVQIGQTCMICGMVGISGSVRIGDRVRIGGGVGIADHVTIGDGAVIAAGSGVASNVPAGVFVSGFPAQPHQRTLENFLYLGRQKRLHGRVDALQARLEALERVMGSNGAGVNDRRDEGRD